MSAPKTSRLCACLGSAERGALTCVAAGILPEAVIGDLNSLGKRGSGDPAGSASPRGRSSGLRQVPLERAACSGLASGRGSTTRSPSARRWSSALRSGRSWWERRILLFQRTPASGARPACGFTLLAVPHGGGNRTVGGRSLAHRRDGSLAPGGPDPDVNECRNGAVAVGLRRVRPSSYTSPQGCAGAGVRGALG